MIRLVFLYLAILGVAFASPSTTCAQCHATVVKEWESSAHAMAHTSKNELFTKMALSVSKTKGMELQKVEGKCNLCHAPYDKGEMKAEGVTCVACHKIDTFGHQDTSKPPVGKNMISWMKENIMAGPSGKGQSPYHGITQREFMGKQSDQLCYTCHNTMKNEQKVTVCNTGGEYREANQSKSCVDCHMGSPKKGFVSSLSSQPTHVRSHAFHGARNSDILTKAVTLWGKKEKETLHIELTNLSTHSFPTGTGARLAVVTTQFFNGKKPLEAYSEKLSISFTTLEGNVTLPPLSEKVESDTRLKPNEKRVISYPLPKGATKATIHVDYFLASPALAEKFSLTQGLFTKSYPVISREITLR